MCQSERLDREFREQWQQKERQKQWEQQKREQQQREQQSRQMEADQRLRDMQKEYDRQKAKIFKGWCPLGWTINSQSLWTVRGMPE